MKMRSIPGVGVSCLSACLIVITLVAGGSVALAQEQAGQQEGDDDQIAEREAGFKEMLDGATLVGHFTMTRRDTSDLKQERYKLHSVEKLPNGRWMFRAQIRYGDHDVTVPLPLPVKWAGDTPIIVVDKLDIPALGTFDARVMFFRNHYAGYWSHGENGGHLFGVIERDGEENIEQ